MYSGWHEHQHFNQVSGIRGKDMVKQRSRAYLSVKLHRSLKCAILSMLDRREGEFHSKSSVCCTFRPAMLDLAHKRKLEAIKSMVVLRL